MDLIKLMMEYLDLDRIPNLYHSLTNFEIPKYYRNKIKIIGVYSQNNLSDNVKNEALVVNLNKYKSIGTH